MIIRIVLIVADTMLISVMLVIITFASTFVLYYFCFLLSTYNFIVATVYLPPTTLALEIDFAKMQRATRGIDEIVSAHALLPRMRCRKWVHDLVLVRCVSRAVEIAIFSAIAC